jgi:hypothetical protein
MQEGAHEGQLPSLAYAMPAPIPAAARDRPVTIAAPATMRDRRFTGSSLRYCGSVVEPVDERLHGRPWRILGAAFAPGVFGAQPCPLPPRVVAGSFRDLREPRVAGGTELSGLPP